MAPSNLQGNGAPYRAPQSPTLTRLAAQRVEEIRSGTLTDEVREKAKLCLLDYLGALVSGLTSAPWAPALLRCAQKSVTGSEGAGQAHIMGLEAAVSAETAAFYNASIAHSVIRDDIHLDAGAHIGVLVIPAALALAQRDGWTGDQLAKGLVAGYEVAALLGVSVRATGLGNPHFRLSGIVGAFGAAGAGIAADDTITTSMAASALGFAANSAAGFNEWPWAGGMEIMTQMGTASRSGITSLDLATAGLYSSDTVLEGEDGLFAAYGCAGPAAGGRFREWLATAELGHGILGARFKPLPGCNFIQTPLSVALKLHPKLAGVIRQVRQVLVVTTTLATAYPGCDHVGPFDKVQQTKMSIQYGVAAALLLGRIDESAYVQFDSPELHELMSKCILDTRPSYDEALRTQAKQPCRIEISMEDGTIHEDYLPDVPWLQAQAVEERFAREAGEVFDPATVAQLAGAIRQLEHGDNCARLLQLLSVPTKITGAAK